MGGGSHPLLVVTQRRDVLARVRLGVDRACRVLVPAPRSSPRFTTLLADLFATAHGTACFEELTREGLGAAPGGKYRHWDTFWHTSPSTRFTAEEQWITVKLSRRALYQPLPLKDIRGMPFQYALPNPAMEMLHQIDRNAGGSLLGNIQGHELVTNPATRDTYLSKSIVEEAITSSQLEGASTSRKVAKAMIQEGCAPSNRSERMILNNYEGMLYVRTFIHAPLTLEIVIKLQPQRSFVMRVLLRAIADLHRYLARKVEQSNTERNPRQLAGKTFVFTSAAKELVGRESPPYAPPRRGAHTPPAPATPLSSPAPTTARAPRRETDRHPAR